MKSLLVELTGYSADSRFPALPALFGVIVTMNPMQISGLPESLWGQGTYEQTAGSAC